jgi:hypothetical protein
MRSCRRTEAPREPGAAWAMSAPKMIVPGGIGNDWASSVQLRPPSLRFTARMNDERDQWPCAQRSQTDWGSHSWSRGCRLNAGGDEGQQTIDCRTSKRRHLQYCSAALGLLCRTLLAFMPFGRAKGGTKASVSACQAAIRLGDAHCVTIGEGSSVSEMRLIAS